MTDLRKAAERLLEALEDGWVQRDDWVAFELRQQLAQPEQEPVAWGKSYDLVCALLRQAHDILATTQYPIKRPWVGLTDEERRRYNDRLSGSGVAEEIEAKLKEKNGGV